jgi:hypothetical protein
VTELERILPQLATKADLAEVRADLERFATKADLAEVRADLERCATKADLATGLSGLRTHMLVLHEGVLAEIRRAIELLGGRSDRHEQRLDEHAKALDDHGSRIRLLEDVRRLRRK